MKSKPFDGFDFDVDFVGPNGFGRDLGLDVLDGDVGIAAGVIGSNVCFLCAAFFGSFVSCLFVHFLCFVDLVLVSLCLPSPKNRQANR